MDWKSMISYMIKHAKILDENINFGDFIKYSVDKLVMYFSILSNIECQL